MGIVDVDIIQESQERYLTYALSVVNSRALPDVRDGLKPVQRRILFAMVNNLHLTPEKHHRKSAAVVGEVLARYHPHGDGACYDAMVRMAQDFNFRYPLIDGQGNFGSLDGDSAAAYRYTEAKLAQLAIEVIGDIGQQTIAERPNFDQTTSEPVVLPSRVPNLLMNGASGIAVGMATAIPPHNLGEIVKALLLLLEEPEVQDKKLLSVIKGPDFPTGCLILNTQAELREIYTTGKGAIRMRASHEIENDNRGKVKIVITSVPYAVDKSVLVEKIADLIIAKKLPQLVDIRDESTDQVRVVLEVASGADPEKALNYLFKNTSLQTNFNVNLTALVPTKNPLSGKPALLSLREMLQHFLDFRIEVTRAKLLYEKGKLQERIHLLEGLMLILDVLDEVIEIVRKSGGRADSAEKLQKRFKLSEVQAFFIVDLRIYQLSRTSVEEVRGELDEKLARVAAINGILESPKALRGEVARDLERVSTEYGDPRRSKVVSEFEEVQLDAEHYIQHEEVHVIVTKDGWLKRVRQTNDPQTTRLREGDSLFYTAPASTKDLVCLFTNRGNLFVAKVFDLVATPGFGEPVQKMFRFQDEEQIVCALVVEKGGESTEQEVLVYTEGGLGYRLKAELAAETKKTGKKLVRVGDEDRLAGVKVMPKSVTEKDLVLLVSEQGYGLLIPLSEVPVLGGAAKGVILQRPGKGDKLVGVAIGKKNAKVSLLNPRGGAKEVELHALTIGQRAQRGDRVVPRGPVTGVIEGVLN